MFHNITCYILWENLEFTGILKKRRGSQANRLVAQLGCYLGRKGDGPPGPASFGLGLRCLHFLAWGWTLARDEEGCV
jgi:hypothetical protein